MEYINTQIVRIRTILWYSLPKRVRYNKKYSKYDLHSHEYEEIRISIMNVIVQK